MKQFDYAYATVETNYQQQVQTWTLEDISFSSSLPHRAPPLEFLKLVGESGWELIMPSGNEHLFKKEIPELDKQEKR